MIYTCPDAQATFEGPDPTEDDVVEEITWFDIFVALVGK